jgi:hypothetical protein
MKDPTPEERMAARTARWGLLAAQVTETDRTVEVALEAPSLVSLPKTATARGRRISVELH